MINNLKIVLLLVVAYCGIITGYPSLNGRSTSIRGSSRYRGMTERKATIYQLIENKQ